MMKWLRDTYNGLYVILLKPYMPSERLVISLLIGFFIGLIVAYGLFPTVYYNSDPRTLEQSWQDQWVKMLADSRAVANADVGAYITDMLARIDDPLGTVDRLLSQSTDQNEVNRLSAIRDYAVAAQPNAAQAPEPNAVGTILPWIVIPIVVVIVFVLVIVLYGMFIYPNLVEPLMKRIRGEKVSEEVLRMRQQVAAQREADSTMRTDFTTSNQGPPIFQRISTYSVGMGTYDYSYSIETAAGAFLGECGVTGSETIGTADDTFTAIEIWLFDKDDYSKTITKVLVSQNAFNDPAMRARLEPKGDLVLVQPGVTTLLETSSLRLQARVVDFEYGSGALPPNSYFQRMTVELAAWKKDAVGAPVPATPAPAVTVSTPVTAPAVPPQTMFAPPPPSVLPPAAPAQAPVTQPIGSYTNPPAPPPTMPPSMPPSTPAPNPYSGGVRPAAPPPPPRRIDDDPFGGTAEFKP
ncbi:MAG: hypothetical protein U0670_12470 [Anaerolineae bacterium]